VTVFPGKDKGQRTKQEPTFSDRVSVTGVTYTFKPSNHGVHTFSTALTTVGSATMTATDLTHTSVQPGSAASTVLTTAVALTPDPADPSDSALVVIVPRGGTVVVTPANVSGTAVDVTINQPNQIANAASAVELAAT
jgi:hypothetical protein